MRDLEMIEQGDGELVVLFHGAASHSGQWRSLINQLKSSYRVVCFNQYGYGNSPSWSAAHAMTFEDQVKPVVNYLNAKPGGVHLVGHSHGGTLAALTAITLGDRVKSLSIYEPNSFRILQPDDSQHMTQYEIIKSSFGDLNERGSTLKSKALFAEELLDFWLGQGAWIALPQRLQDQLISLMDATIGEVHAALHCPIDITPLKRLKARMLLMFDPHTPPAALEVTHRFCEILPQCKVQTLPHCGHLGPIFHADRVNQVICQHLKSCT